MRHHDLAIRKVDNEMGLHQPQAFGTGTFFFFLGVSGVGATSWIMVAPCNGGGIRVTGLDHHVAFLAEFGEVFAQGGLHFLADTACS